MPSTLWPLTKTTTDGLSLRSWILINQFLFLIVRHTTRWHKNSSLHIIAEPSFEADTATGCCATNCVNSKKELQVVLKAAPCKTLILCCKTSEREVSLSHTKIAEKIFVKRSCRRPCMGRGIKRIFMKVLSTSLIFTVHWRAFSLWLKKSLLGYGHEKDNQRLATYIFYFGIQSPSLWWTQQWVLKFWMWQV